jgi:hypothetical protein
MWKTDYLSTLFLTVWLGIAYTDDISFAQVLSGSAESPRSVQAGGDWSLGPAYALSPAYPSPQVDCDRLQPTVAYDSKRDRFLVAWHEVLQGTGSQIIMVGTANDGRPLSYPGYSLQGSQMGSGYRIEQAAAVYNGTADEYFIVHMQELDDPVAGGTQFQLWAKRLDGDFYSKANRTRIFTWAYRTFQTPRVAWNSNRNEYMVVWTALNTSVNPPQVNDVAGVRVGADGYPVSALASFLSTSQFPQQIDIAYDSVSDRYFCVWRRLFSGGDWDLDGAYISGDAGTLINPPGIFIVSNAGGDERHPSVSAGGNGKFLVAWERWDLSPQADIYRRVFDAYGNALESSEQLSSSSYTEIYPRTAYRAENNQRMVLWQRGISYSDIPGMNQGDAGPNLGRQFLQISDVNADCTRPALAVGRRRYLIVYEMDYPLSVGIKQHIFARSWGPLEVFLPLLAK